MPLTLLARRPTMTRAQPLYFRRVMTPNQIRATIARLGVSQSQLARLLRTDVRTVQRWVDRKRPIQPPRSVELMLWLVLTGKLTFEDLEVAESQLIAAEGGAGNARVMLHNKRVWDGEIEPGSNVILGGWPTRVKHGARLQPTPVPDLDQPE